jgi:hypothetical protein
MHFRKGVARPKPNGLRIEDAVEGGNPVKEVFRNRKTVGVSKHLFSDSRLLRRA